MATQKQLCIVEINYIRLLMPIEKGLKITSLLADAREVDSDFTDGHKTYKLRDRPLELSLELVSASAIRMPDSQPAAGRTASRRKALPTPTPLISEG